MNSGLELAHPSSERINQGLSILKTFRMGHLRCGLSRCLGRYGLPHLLGLIGHGLRLSGLIAVILAPEGHQLAILLVGGGPEDQRQDT